MIVALRCVGVCAPSVRACVLCVRCAPTVRVQRAGCAVAASCPCIGCAPAARLRAGFMPTIHRLCVGEGGGGAGGGRGGKGVAGAAGARAGRFWGRGRNQRGGGRQAAVTGASPPTPNTLMLSVIEGPSANARNECLKRSLRCPPDYFCYRATGLPEQGMPSARGQQPSIRPGVGREWLRALIGRA